MPHQVALSPELQDCIEKCWRCHMVCLNMATNHCLKAGGSHAESQHIKTMLVCAEICRTAANVMAMDSTLHRQVCAVCADICDSCLTSCNELDGMDECIKACRHCRDSCQSMTSV